MRKLFVTSDFPSSNSKDYVVMQALRTSYDPDGVIRWKVVCDTEINEEDIRKEIESVEYENIFQILEFAHQARCLGEISRVQYTTLRYELRQCLRNGKWCDRIVSKLYRWRSALNTTPSSNG